MVGRTKAVVGKVWSLEEKNFGKDRNKRIYLFDALIRSVMQYGAKIWGWEEWKKLDKIRKCNIKWSAFIECLQWRNLDRSTPQYSLLNERKIK